MFLTRQKIERSQDTIKTSLGFQTISNLPPIDRNSKMKSNKQ